MIESSELRRAKAIARGEGLTRRRAIGETERADADRRIMISVLGTPEWQAAKTVAVYWSLADEVQTHQLIEFALADGKTVVLPRRTPSGILFQEISGTGELVDGPHGIMEPPPLAHHVLPADIDIILVPGAAFGRDLERVGMGGGDFDRILKATRAQKWGLAYEKQMRDTVPHGPGDVRMDRVITERNIYYGEP